MPDSTDAILQSILETAQRDHWSAAERLQALALVARDRPVGKPAWKSASFWLLGLSTAAALTVAAAGAIGENKTAAAVGTAAATVLAATQAVTNSRDKRHTADTAARKYEATLAGLGAPPPPPVPAGCEVCGGTGRVFRPDEHGKVDPVCPTRPCPACQAEAAP